MLIALLRSHLRPYRRPLAAVLALTVVSTLAALYLPSLNARIIDDGVARGDLGLIWRLGEVMALVSVVQVAASVAGVYLGARMAMGFGRDVRAAVFDRVLSFSARELGSFGAPSLITRTTNDVQQVQMLVLMSSTMLLSAPLTMVGGVVMALREDVVLSWLVVAAVPVLAVSVGLVIRQMTPRFRQMQGRIDTVNRVLREQLSGIRVVRAFVREPFEAERFGRANAELTATSTAVGRLMASIFPIVMLVLNLSSVAVLWFGAIRIDRGEMQVGALTAFLAYLVQILMSVMMATFLLVLAPRAAVCAERIVAVLDTDSSLVVAEHPVRELPRPGVAPGTLRFADVEFRYPGAAAPVLSGVEFTAEPGRTTAVVGSTGAGKTTLVSLAARLVDATGGAVLLDGADVRDLDPEDVWARVGLVPQQAFLFSGTVASNLRYGRPDATDEELWEALGVAQAEEFVRAMPGGLDAEISQGGTTVSGGQRQRLAIARALVKRPAVYLFDDSFSALDVATDARLRAALRTRTADAAVVVVAQRVATIADADLIVVLEHGRVVGSGTHTELLQTCPTYAEIVDSQRTAEADVGAVPGAAGTTAGVAR